MEKSGLAGLATFVMRGKEYLVAIFLIMEFCGRNDALCRRASFSRRSRPAEKEEGPPAAVRKFEKLIAANRKKSLPARNFRMNRRKRVKLVKKKEKKRSNVVEVETETREPAKVIDLSPC